MINPNILSRAREFFKGQFGDHPRSTGELVNKVRALCADVKDVITYLSVEDKQTQLADVRKNWVYQNMIPSGMVDYGSNAENAKKINPHIYVYEIIEKIINMLSNFKSNDPEETRQTAVAWQQLELTIGNQPLARFSEIMDEFLNKINSPLA